MLDLIFYNLSFVILIFSVLMVILLNNPIYCILYFLFYFLNVVMLLLGLGMEFIGLLYLIIYIGAITILFLFVVMMLNLKTIEWNLYLYKFLPLGSIFAVIFLLEFFYAFQPFINVPVEAAYTLYLIDWLRISVGLTFFSAIASVLYSYYGYSVILSGYILLVALVGAIVLSLMRKKPSKNPMLVPLALVNSSSVKKKKFINA